MHTSTDRILTTHAGSIPRGEPLGQMLIDEEAGKPVDNGALESNIGLRVSHVLEKQAEAGIDIINDGEQGRVGFQTYVIQRMSGFGGVSKRPYGKEFIEYPQFTKRMMERLSKISKVFDAPQATADIKYRDTARINAEIERLTRLSAAVKPRVTEFFMNAPSPGIVTTTMLNAHYASHEAYLDAVAREIRTEYLAVIKAGFVLQIDAPDLAMERVLLFQDMSDMEYAKLVEQHVAALHMHKLPDKLILIPGVIDPKSNIVEHPEVVAQRIETVVAAVGDRERVIAGVDCGFGTFVGWEWVTEDVVWAKLSTLRAGAEIASKRLWSRKVA